MADHEAAYEAVTLAGTSALLTGVVGHVRDRFTLARIGLIALLAASCGGEPTPEPAGLLVVSDEDDLYVEADGSGRRVLVERLGRSSTPTGRPTARGSLHRTRGKVNVDDEIYAVDADGLGRGEPHPGSGRRLVARLVVRRRVIAFASGRERCGSSSWPPTAPAFGARLRSGASTRRGLRTASGSCSPPTYGPTGDPDYDLYVIDADGGGCAT